MSQQAWDRELGIDVQEIDAEHQLQIGLVRALEKSVGGKDREEAGRLLEQLHDYTRVHFAAEELMMRLHAYPGYGEHEAEHGKLLEQLEEIRKAWKGGGVQPTRELVIALRHWLVEHVQTFDRGLGRYLKSPGSGGDAA
jgi:hemerythrin